MKQMSCFGQEGIDQNEMFGKGASTVKATECLQFRNIQEHKFDCFAR